jgi:hypothetical protein
VLYHQYGRPVHSAAVLLRPRVDRGDLTGQVRFEALLGRGWHDFRFEVVRLWERPAEDFLAGGLGTVPLAVLGRLPEGLPVEDGLAPIVQAVVERLLREAAPPVAGKLITAAYLLTGLRVAQEVAQVLFRRVEGMHESTTYQAILDEGQLLGRTDEARRILLRLGQSQFGPPDTAEMAALQAITDTDRLELLCERVRAAATWQELLAAL